MAITIRMLDILVAMYKEEPGAFALVISSAVVGLGVFGAMWLCDASANRRARWRERGEEAQRAVEYARFGEILASLGS